MPCLCLYNGKGARDKELSESEWECHLMIRRTRTISTSLWQGTVGNGVCYCFSVGTHGRNKWMGAKWCSVRKCPHNRLAAINRMDSDSYVQLLANIQLMRMTMKKSTRGDNFCRGAESHSVNWQWRWWATWVFSGQTDTIPLLTSRRQWTDVLIASEQPQRRPHPPWPSWAYLRTCKGKYLKYFLLTN